MKKAWKWVIGIAVTLVILAALAIGAFLLRNHFANVTSLGVNRPGIQVPGYGWDGRYPGMMPFGNHGWGGRYVIGFGRMMPFGGLIGGLFSLGLLALVVLGIIWLVKSLRKPTVVMATVEPVASVEPVAPVDSAVISPHLCPRCSEPVQDDWKHCPNCGKKL